jgi:hypothetical protein
MNTIEPKAAQPKPSTTRKTRSSRAQSEDRFRSSTLSLNNAAGDTTSSSSSHSYLPSYAAHTSSSMSKLREGTITTPPPPSVPVLASSSSITSLAMNSQTRRVPSSVVSLDNRSKNMMKSRSTQNLILPTTNTQQSKLTLRRIKISRVSRRPPNLPTAINNQSSTSSSASSNTSSPTKINQTKENDQTKQYIHPTSSSSLQESGLPLRQLDNTTNDLMPKWAQDCFYRTVVLGLKPLLLQDIPGSPSKPPKRSSSTCSVESSDSLETTSELQACTLNDNNNNNEKEIKVRRSISIPDYRQIKLGHKILPASLSERKMNDTKEE